MLNRNQRIIHGSSRVVNLTNYKQGYSIISLEASSNKNRPAYATLIQVLAGVPQKPVAN